MIPSLPAISLIINAVSFSREGVDVLLIAAAVISFITKGWVLEGWGALQTEKR